MGPDPPTHPDVPPAPPPPAGIDLLRQLVSLYPWPQDAAILTAWCESRWDETAIGHETYQGKELYFYGWFQDEGGPADPAANVAEAFRQWDEWQRGKRANPWPGCWPGG